MNARLDRYGDPIDGDDQPTPHDQRCQRGWLGTNADGALIPCPTCRPETVRRVREQQARWSG